MTQITPNRSVTVSALLFVLFFSFPSFVFGHCQIPCGIYDDHARVKTMLEDVATIEKSVKMLQTLNTGDPQSANQVVRWVMNKETHAQNIISTISDYFLTQRVKTSQGDYVERLKKHHAVIVAAMKAKQSSTSEVVLTLKQAVENLAPYYPPHDH